MTKNYRQNVAGIISFDGHLLLCERSDYVGEWQFPQGGIKQGESPKQAFFREMEEELGIDGAIFRNLKISQKTYKYDYPESATKVRTKYTGQEQAYVLAEIDHFPKITLNYEFRSSIWCLPKYIESFNYSFFKKTAAIDAMREFHLI